MDNPPRPAKIVPDYLGASSSTRRRMSPVAYRALMVPFLLNPICLAAVFMVMEKLFFDYELHSQWPELHRSAMLWSLLIWVTLPSLAGIFYVHWARQFMAEHPELRGKVAVTWAAVFTIVWMAAVLYVAIDIFRHPQTN